MKDIWREFRSDNPYYYFLTVRLKDRHCLEMLDIKAGERVLDIGCGTGYFLELFSFLNIKPYGLDYSFDSLKYCQQRVPSYLCKGDALLLPFRDNVFDKVLFADVIEHLRDDSKVLSEISRVSKDGAIMSITTASLEGLLTGSKLNRLFHNEKDTPQFHVRDGYSFNTFRRLLEKHSIKVVEKRYATTFFSELFIEFSKLILSLKDRSYKDQSYSKRIEESTLFRIYKKFIFPAVLKASRFEEKVLSPFLKGHSIIVKGRVCKGKKES